MTWSVTLFMTLEKFNCLLWKGLFHDSSHPCGDVVVKAVDKMHQFDSEQTHSVNLLIYRLFDLYFFTQCSLQFLWNIREIYRNKPFPIIETLHGEIPFTWPSCFQRAMKAHTAEPECVQTVFGPFDLQQEEKHLIVDLLTLGADHNVNRPGNLHRAK